MVRRLAVFALLAAIGSGVLVLSTPTPGRAELEINFVVAPVAPAAVILVAPYAPPVAPVEVISYAPGPGYVWVGGHYVWRGRWVWVPGYWGRPPYGYAVWVPGHWDRRPGGWIWVEGRWRR